MNSEMFLRADAIAQTLNDQRTDVNELSNCIQYLHNITQERNSGSAFFEYLDTIITEGQSVVRSGRTLSYYRAIREVCREHLDTYQNDPETMAWILGWAARLMRYYAVEDRLGKPVRHHPRPKKTDRRTGTVKWFSKNKGYGFIKPDGSGDDHFFHISETPVKQGLKEKQQVSFVSEMGDKGPKARDVKPL